MSRGELEGARGHFEHALRLVPGSVQARYNLGVVYRDLELSEMAWVEFIDVLSRDGRMAGAYNNLAILEERLETPRRGRGALSPGDRTEKAIPRRPLQPGNAIAPPRRFPRGVRGMRMAMADQPVHAVPGPASALGRQTSGRHPAGPQRAGAGMRCSSSVISPSRPSVATASSSSAPRTSFPLFRSLPGVAELRGPGNVQVSEFHAYLPLMSLPHVLGTTLETVPARVPYLRPDPRSLDLRPVADPEPAP